MFIILAYDVNQKRVGKVLKTCRRYLHHVQKSVFEGTITESKLNHLKQDLQKIINTEEDSIFAYERVSKDDNKKVLVTSFSNTQNAVRYLFYKVR